MEPSTPMKRRSIASDEYRFYSRPRFDDTTYYEKTEICGPAVIEMQSNAGNEPYSCDVVFSFDTTGSMRSVIDNVRQNLKTTIEKLFEEVPGIRIGLIAHGDYCDYPRMMWKISPTKDVEALKEFIIDNKNSSGGDAPECYEYVLHVANGLDWKADVRVLVVIGDESPHEKGYCMPRKIPGFTSSLHIDWKEEATKLKEKNVTIFSCHALPDNNRQSIPFYTTIATMTKGIYLKLDEFADFQHYMVTICLKASDDAEALELIKRRQDELEKMLQDMSLETTERESLRMEMETTSAAIDGAERGEHLTSPAFLTATKSVRKAYKTPNKTNTYIKSVRETVRNVSTQNTFSTFYDPDEDDEMKE